MHLNSFNKLVNYLLETNEGVFRYSDLTGEPQLEIGEDKYFRRYKDDSQGSEISEEEFEKAKAIALKDLTNGYFTLSNIDYYKEGLSDNRTNKKLFNSQGYINKLENMLTVHLNHKIALFLNDTEKPYIPRDANYRKYANIKPTSVAVEVPSDVIGLELSMYDNLGDEPDTLAMLTPWIVGHRLGHQMPVEVARGIYNILDRLIRDNRHMIDFKDYDSTTLPINVVRSMFNFKSIKNSDNYFFVMIDDEAGQIGEFYHEIFAQYAKYGKVTIHNVGTPEERADTARQIEQIFSSWLDTLKGEVTNIDG